MANELLQGMARPRPPRGRSQAHPGVHPLSPISHTQRFEPLPRPIAPPPYHYALETAIPGIEATAKKQKKLVFHLAADVGGIKHPEYQRGVAAAMKGDLELPHGQAPSFLYICGDVVYYGGQVEDYYDQFYEPYDNYNVPILAIPGNHDGTVIGAESSLEGFVRYFMTPTPIVQPESSDAPRATMSLPNVYFTLDCPYVTIIGMYTNVPEGGSIDSIQQQWLTNEFATAPTDKALILALHHPVYSFDDHHSGSARMADAVQHAINDSRRVPNLVLTGHVHNYQRIEKDLVDDGPTPFFVLGHGGYWHMHGMSAAAGHTDPDTRAKLVFEEHKRHGYLTVTVDAHAIKGTMTLTDPVDQDPQRDVDTFSYPTKALSLKDGVVVSL